MLVRSIKYFSRRSVFVGGLGVVAGSVLSSCVVSRPAPSRTEGFSSSSGPMEMASLGHSGSQQSQLMHSSVMFHF